MLLQSHPSQYTNQYRAIDSQPFQWSNQQEHHQLKATNPQAHHQLRVSSLEEEFKPQTHPLCTIGFLLKYSGLDNQVEFKDHNKANPFIHKKASSFHIQPVQDTISFTNKTTL